MAKKKSRLNTWFDLPQDEVAKRTTQFAKGYLAHKAEETSSPYAHNEYMEQAELWGNPDKDTQ